MNTGGAESSGVGNMLVCNGGMWKSILGFNGSAQVTKFGNNSCGNGDVLVFDGTKFVCGAATGVTADALDFTEFKDAMTLDASTDIAASGINVLSITNTGTGNSLTVNDQAGDATPFVIDAAGNVGVGTSTPSQLLHLYANNADNAIRFETAGAVTGSSPGTAGAAYATAAANDTTVGGSNSWTNPGNATTSDNSKATRALTSGGGVSQYIKATGFGFSIPAGATIDGIKVEWEKMTSSTSGGSSCQDYAVRIVKGGAIQGVDKSIVANWSTSDAFASYGSSTDLWGDSWTPADINSSTFGAALSAKNSGSTSRTCSVDSVRITVSYTTYTIGTANWTVGVDQSDGKMKISSSTAPGTSDAVAIDASNNTTVNGDLTVTGACAGCVPSGAVMAFDLASCPAGWSEYTAARGRFLRGLDNGAGLDPDGTRSPGSQQPGSEVLYNWDDGSGGWQRGVADQPDQTTNWDSTRTVNGITGGLMNRDNTSSITREYLGTVRPANVAVLFCRKN